jgi:AcrR family transcriptional regulator
MSINNDLKKKELIKKASRDLFFRFGFNKTAMEDIARQSGLAKPTLYYYYESKNAIFNEIVIEEATHFMDKVQAKIPVRLPANEKIALFFRTTYQDLKIYASRMAKMPDIMCEYSPHGRPIVHKINEIFREKILPLIEAGQTDGTLISSEKETIANTLVFMTDFLNLDWLRHHSEETCDQVVETMIEIILNGLNRRNK